MGNAAKNPSDQFHYIKNRVQMLHEVVESIDADQAEMEDLDRVITMVQKLQMKMDRFKKDWEE